MADFATLILGAQTDGLKKGEAALTSLSATAGRTQARVVSSMTATGSAMQRVGASAALGGGGMRMFTQQLSQVGQQGSVTGNYLGALAVQLPDIGLAFGVVGTIIGTVAAVAIPTLISALGGASSKTKEVRESLDALSGAAGAYVSAAKAAGMSTDDLAAKYGSLAGEAGKALEAMRQVGLVDAMTAVDAAVKKVVGSLTEMQTVMGSGGRAQALAFANDFGLAADQAERIQVALFALSGADGLQAQADAAIRVQDALIQAYGSAEAMPAPLRASYGAMAEIVIAAGEVQGATESGTVSIYDFADGANAAANALSGAIGMAQGLAASAAQAAQNIWAAVGAMVAARQAQAAAVGGGRGIGPQGVVGGGVSAQDPYGFRAGIRQANAFVPALRAVGSAGRAAGGGISAGAKEGQKALSDAQTAAEKLKEEIDRPIVTAIGSMSDAFGDFVARGFKDFKGFAKSILGSFQQMISQMISYAIKNKIMIGLGMGGSVAGGAASAAGIGGGGGGAGLLGQIGGIASAFTGGITSVFSGILSGGFGGGISAIGTALSGAGAGLTGLATAAGAIALPLLAIVGIFSFFKKKTRELDAGLRVTVGGMNALVETFKVVETKRFWGLSKKVKTTYTAADGAVADPITGAVADIQNGVRDAARALGIAGTTFRGFAHEISISTKGLTDDQIVAEIQKQLGGLGDAYAKMIPGLRRFALEGEGAMATLTRLSQSLTVANMGFKSLGFALFDTSIAGAGAAAKLIKAMGGLDAFAASVDFYFTNFYSLGEQAQEIGRKFRTSLRGIGVNGTVPRSMEQFRALVDRLMAAGRTVVAGQLMNLAPLFTQLLDLRGQVRDLGDTSGVSADQLAKLQAIADERYGLETRLLTLQGDTVALHRRELLALDPANRALMRQIWAQERLAAAADRATAAADRAAARAKRVADERTGIEDRILQLQGRTGEIRRRELAELFPGNRALQERYYRLLDEAEALEASRAVAEERKGLEQRLLELQGNTAELRRRELAALDPANRALLNMIYGLEDAKEAIEAVNETDFATLFDFRRAQGRAANTNALPLFGAPRQLGAASQPQGDDNAVRLEIREMRAGLEKVIRDGNEAHRASAINTAEILKLERRWEAVGLPKSRLTL